MKFSAVPSSSLMVIGIYHLFHVFLQLLCFYYYFIYILFHWYNFVVCEAVKRYEFILLVNKAFIIYSWCLSVCVSTELTLSRILIPWLLFLYDCLLLLSAVYVNPALVACSSTDSFGNTLLCIPYIGLCIIVWSCLECPSFFLHLDSHPCYNSPSQRISNSCFELVYYSLIL